jgi:hypothetical protein
MIMNNDKDRPPNPPVWWKRGGKRYIKTRLLIACLIFAMVGWFLLAIMAFEDMLEDQLTQVEIFIESPGFTWGLRAFILLSIILLIRKNELFDRLVQNRTFKIAFYIFLGIGATGWIWGLLSLIP